MTLPEGTTLENRYRIDHLLARGGMGAIYRGFDTNLSIPVAIKENFFQTPHSVNQFKQEARILARLHHPNLPRVIHHFSYQKQQYLVMDFIEGVDLWQMVKARGRPLEERNALDYLIQVCDAVDYLHRQNPPIIHRDIKPQNIKITPDGQAVLVDFGIAKVVEAGGHTRTGAQGVTPGFSPPEQYSGEGTSPPSDVYSLGATLYAVLTGKKPPPSVSLLVDRKKFKAPAELNDKLSKQVSQAVMHAMQPLIENRAQSALAWKQELEAIFDTPTEPQPQPDHETTLFGGKGSPGWLVGPGGLTYQIRMGDQTLGRASTCDIQLNDPRASRQHATVKFDGNRCLVFDSGSANGTLVNGRPVSDGGQAIAPGDRLRIGDTTMLFSATKTPTGMQPIVSKMARPIDELAGTAFMPESEISEKSSPVSPSTAPAAVPAVQPLPAAPPVQPAKKGSSPWLWLLFGLMVILLAVTGALAYFVMQNGGQTEPTPNLEAIIAAAVTATEQAEAGEEAGKNVEATLSALAATATKQAQTGLEPPVDTEATVAAAIAATEQAKPDTPPPTKSATNTLVVPPVTPTFTPSPTGTAVPPTGTSTSISPTSTPVPPTRTRTPTPTLMPSATARATATPIVSAPLGVFQDFESDSFWKRGDEPNGELNRTSSEAFAGNFAGQLSYSFPTSNNDYVVFLQSRPLAGQPRSISAWILGDGQGHFLNTWIKDAAGQSWQMSFGQIKHTGWKEMTAIIDPNQPWPSGHISGPNNGVVDYPISFQGLVLDDGSDTFSGRGSIYIDNLTSRKDTPTSSATSTPNPVAPPRSTATPAQIISSLYQLAVAGQHRYETWGAPQGDDICEAFRTGNFNDKIHMKGFNLELSLTNKSTLPVADNWLPTFITARGKSVQACFYGYDGSGPQPGATTYMTFFTIVDADDYVRVVRLNVNGETLQICLNTSGAQSPC